MRRRDELAVVRVDRDDEPSTVPSSDSGELPQQGHGDGLCGRMLDPCPLRGVAWEQAAELMEEDRTLMQKQGKACDGGESQLLRMQDEVALFEGEVRLGKRVIVDREPGAVIAEVVRQAEVDNRDVRVEAQALCSNRRSSWSVP